MLGPPPQHAGRHGPARLIQTGPVRARYFPAPYKMRKQTANPSHSSPSHPHPATPHLPRAPPPARLSPSPTPTSLAPSPRRPHPSAAVTGWRLLLPLLTPAPPRRSGLPSSLCRRAAPPPLLHAARPLRSHSTRPSWRAPLQIRSWRAPAWWRRPAGPAGVTARLGGGVDSGTALPSCGHQARRGSAPRRAWMGGGGVGRRA